MVTVTERIAACRDPTDDVPELAVNGRGDLIVSGDGDLLVLNPFRSIPYRLANHFLTVGDTLNPSFACTPKGSDRNRLVAICKVRSHPSDRVLRFRR